MTLLQHICIHALSLCFTFLIILFIICPISAVVGSVFTVIGTFVVNSFGPYGTYYFFLFSAVIFRKNNDLWRAIETIFLFVAIIIATNYFEIVHTTTTYSAIIVYSGFVLDAFPIVYGKAVATIKDHLLG